MYQTRDFEIFPVSAMEKVRGGCRPQLFEDEGTALTGERAAFQVAYRSVRRTLTDLSYRVEGLPEGQVYQYGDNRRGRGQGGRLCKVCSGAYRC